MANGHRMNSKSNYPTYNGINSHKVDIYRLNLEALSDSYILLHIDNVISWDSMMLKVTKEELRGLADFILKYLEDNDYPNSHTTTGV